MATEWKNLPDTSTPILAANLIKDQTAVQVTQPTGGQNVWIKDSKNLLEGMELGDINSNTGEETDSTTVVKSINYIKYDADTTFYFSANSSAVSSNLNIRVYNANKEYIGYASLNKVGGKIGTITKTTSVTDDTPKYFKMRTTVANIGSATTPVMLSLSSALTYEPYIKNPSIYVNETLQYREIYNKDNMGNINVDSISGINLFDKNKCRKGVIISNTGEENENVQYIISDFIKVNPSTDYILNYAFKSTSVARVAQYDINKNFITRPLVDVGVPFTTTSTTYYVKINYNFNYVFNLTFKRNDTSGENVPFLNYGFDYKSEVLFDIDSTLNDNYLTSEGVVTEYSGWSITDYIRVQPNENYITSGSSTALGSSPARCYYDAFKNFISGSAHSNNNPFVEVAPSNAYYMRESIRTSEIGTINITNKSINNDESELYSTNEIKIGTWIDGSDLYRKVYTGTTSSTGNTTVIASSTGFQVVNFKGYIKRTSDNITFPIIGMHSNTGEFCFPFSGSSGTIQLRTSDYSTNTYTYYLIVEYTKSS